MTRQPKDLAQGKNPDQILVVDKFGVYSWSPGMPGANLPCTQVHLAIEGPDALHVIRLKSRKVVDELIAMLIEHRDYVWPEQKK